jgi:hypothetical protein
VRAILIAASAAFYGRQRTHQMRGLCIALTLAALIAGCGIARQRELAAQAAALREQSAAAMKECGEKFPPGNPKIAVTRAQCVNAALAIAQPTLPYPDLLQVYTPITWLSLRTSRLAELRSLRAMQSWPESGPNWSARNSAGG